MLIRQLKSLGITSDIMNIAGLASIFGSIAIWVRADSDGNGHGERGALFVGLWAPTFFTLAAGLTTAEQED